MLCVHFDFEDSFGLATMIALSATDALILIDLHGYVLNDAYCSLRTCINTHETQLATAFNLVNILFHVSRLPLCAVYHIATRM